MDNNGILILLIVVFIVFAYIIYLIVGILNNALKIINNQTIVDTNHSLKPYDLQPERKENSDPRRAISNLDQ